VDSNHRSNLQQIYSLSPLATRETIQIALTSSDYFITENVKNQVVFIRYPTFFRAFSPSPAL
ncbi:hypothetical protein, partial [Hungatella hathewayi]|uniref:hypothetical protein n=1 Tax=Hungatella hathewayi TaxID=154046 RepID=UPI0026E30D40